MCVTVNVCSSGCAYTSISAAIYGSYVNHNHYAGLMEMLVPLAAGVLAPWGVVLHPALGAVLMSLSTVIVALNAQLLRRVPL